MVAPTFVGGERSFKPGGQHVNKETKYGIIIITKPLGTLLP